MSNLNADIFGNIFTSYNEFEEFHLSAYERKEKRILKKH